MAIPLLILATDMPQEELVKIGHDLQKQLHIKDIAYRKDKALLEQRIELLQIQIEEGKEREENMKKMYESMLGALNVSENNDKVKIMKEMHEKELKEMKQLQVEVNAVLKGQINDLRVSLSQCKNELKLIQKLNKSLETKVQESESQIKELEAELEEEKRKLKLLLNEDPLLEKVHKEHSKELERVKEQYEHLVQEIKSIYEKEKNAMEMKLEKTNEEIKELRTYKETHKQNELIEKLQEGYLKQIKTLSNQLTEFKQYATNYDDMNIAIKDVNVNTQIDNSTKYIEENKEVNEKCWEDENKLLKSEREFKKMKKEYEKLRAKIDGKENVVSLGRELKLLVSKLNSTKVKLIQSIKQPSNIQHEEEILNEFKSILDEKDSYKNAEGIPESGMLKESNIKNTIS